MPGAHQIRAQVLAAADQVAQLLLLFARDPHEPQFAGGEQPRQPDRVALVGLDPIPRAALDVPRRADRHLDPLRPRPADQPVASRPGLIDRAQRPRQLAQHVEHLPRPAVDPARDHLPRDIVKDRHRARVRVNVQPDPTHTVRHGRRPPYVWSRPRAQSSTCRTPRNARGVDHQPLAAPGRHPHRVWMRSSGPTLRGACVGRSARAPARTVRTPASPGGSRRLHTGRRRSRRSSLAGVSYVPSETLASVERSSQQVRAPRVGPLLRFVQLSSERARQAVRHDRCFAKKQESPLALLVVIHSRRMPSGV